MFTYIKIREYPNETYSKGTIVIDDDRKRIIVTRHLQPNAAYQSAKVVNTYSGESFEPVRCALMQYIEACERVDVLCRAPAI